MSVAELPWTVLFLVNLAGSLGVTGHVLLNKKNPVSAAAWIGLVRRQIEEATHFQSMLVVYLQTLTPYVDTKDYEFAGLARRTAEDAQVAIVRLQDIARGLAAATSGLSDEMLKRYESLLGRDQRIDERQSDRIHPEDIGGQGDA